MLAKAPSAMNARTTATKRKPFSVSNINDDVLLTLVQWFEALELLSWGMTCKRLYQTIGAKALWVAVAHRLQSPSTRIRLPLAFGDTVESCSVATLQRVTSKACRLDRNLRLSEPRLYRSSRISLSRNPFKREYIPEEAANCVHIVDGRWILYRRPEYLCIRHVEATKQKEIFDIPVVGYASWSFQVTQVDKDVILVTTRHDVNEVYGLLEITLGASKGIKPKVRTIDIGEPFKIQLTGSGLAVMAKNGQTRVSDVYNTRKSTILDHEFSVQRDYLHWNGLLFSVHFQPGGRLQLTAQRVDSAAEQILGPAQSVLKINLKQASSSYPSDHFFAEASLRGISDGMLTIWHRVHMKVKDQVYYAHFVIDVPYVPLEDNLDGEVVSWGHWRFRATYVANGQQYIGSNGASLLLARHVDGVVRLTVYPRNRLKVCDGASKIANRGTSLPFPKENVAGSDVHSVRVAWDDAHGIAVLMLETGKIWVLHYA